MKNAFICFIVGLSTLSFCSVAFTEDTSLKLEQDAEQENGLSHQESSAEQAQPEKFSKNNHKKKPRKKSRKAKRKTDTRNSLHKTEKHKKKSKRKNKNHEVKEDKPQTTDLPSSSQDKQEDLVSEELLDSPKQGE